MKKLLGFLIVFILLAGTAIAKDVNLEWDAVAQAVSYNVYIAEIQKGANNTYQTTDWVFNTNVPAPATTVTVTGLDDKKVFAFMVTAVNSMNEESFASNAAWEKVVPGKVPNVRQP